MFELSGAGSLLGTERQLRFEKRLLLSDCELYCTIYRTCRFTA